MAYVMYGSCKGKKDNIMMEKDAKIYVAGHRGMVGSAIVRALEKKSRISQYCNKNS